MFDQNNRNDQPQVMSMAAFATLRMAERVEDMLQGDLLPMPTVAGQVIVHPASLKKYVAIQGEQGLIWEISPKGASANVNSR